MINIFDKRFDTDNVQSMLDLGCGNGWMLRKIASKYSLNVGLGIDGSEEMINKANEEAEKNVIRVNKDFHNFMENRKKNAEERIRQLKNQAEKDIKNASVKIAIESVEKLIKNSLDKSKLDKIYTSSIEETKLALKKKSS